MLRSHGFLSHTGSRKANAWASSASKVGSVGPCLQAAVLLVVRGWVIQFEKPGVLSKQNKETDPDDEWSQCLLVGRFTRGAFIRTYIFVRDRSVFTEQNSPS